MIWSLSKTNNQKMLIPFCLVSSFFNWKLKMVICHNTSILETSLLKNRQFQEKNKNSYWFFNLKMQIWRVVGKGGGFWPLKLPGRVSTSLNEMEITPLRSKSKGHTWKASWCSLIQLAHCTQHSARHRAGADGTEGLMKKCPQTQSGANCQRQFSQLHCSCHQAFSLYYSEMEFFTGSCMGCTDCMR